VRSALNVLLSWFTSRRTVVALTAVAILLTPSLGRVSIRSYPANPELRLRPFPARVEQIAGRSAPHDRIVYNFHAGRITLFQARGTELIIRGRLNPGMIGRASLVIRSHQPIVLLSDVRGEPMLSDQVQPNAFLITVTTRDGAELSRPCVLADVSGDLTPLGFSAATECAT
jgi:hypothetical protein